MPTIQFPTEFSELLRLLNDRDVWVLVVGGYAVTYHGDPRTTGDLDLWIDRTAERRGATPLDGLINRPQYPYAFATPVYLRRLWGFHSDGSHHRRLEIVSHSCIGGRAGPCIREHYAPGLADVQFCHTGFGQVCGPESLFRDGDVLGGSSAHPVFSRWRFQRT